MEVFIKKLQSQESGYSGNTPNQRGKYIFIPKEAWGHFPFLASGIRNPLVSLRVNTLDNKWVGIYYVWNNNYLFLETNPGRDHNERRIYRNNDLEEALGLDRDVIVAFLRSDENSNDFYAASCPKNDPEYNNLSNLLSGSNFTLINHQEIEKIVPVFAKRLTQNIGKKETEEISIQNQETFLKEVTKKLRETIYLDSSDPLLPLAPMFKNEEDFRVSLRSIYQNKCALRKTSLFANTSVGLEAAHIHQKAESFNFLPNNGILLSTDIHRAFDRGVWTLTDDLKVVVHDKVTDGEILEFTGKTISIPKGNEMYKPHIPNIQWHRNTVFGYFLTMKNIE